MVLLQPAELFGIQQLADINVLESEKKSVTNGVDLLSSILCSPQ
jgi:hypothetical protein